MSETPVRRKVVVLAAPLALSAALAAGLLLAWPRPAVLVLAAASTAAWLGLALWALARADLTAQRVDAAGRQQMLLNEIVHLVNVEVSGTEGEIDRSRRLIREAVAQLNGSFRSMEEQSRRQRTMLTGLVVDEGAGSPGMRGFAEAAGALSGDLARMLAEDSRESGRTVQFVTEIAQNLDDMFELFGELKELAEQAARMAAAAAAPGIPDPRSALMALAFDMRQLTSKSNSFNERIESLMGSSKVIVGRVRSRVEETAAREMKASEEAKARSDGLITQVTAINRSLASGIGLVSECGGVIAEDVGRAVRSLQFEDIATQALGAASVHLKRLQDLVQDVVELQRLLAGPASERDLEAFGHSLRRRQAEWKEQAHKAVSQHTLTSGSVELF